MGETRGGLGFGLMYLRAARGSTLIWYNVISFSSRQGEKEEEREVAKGHSGAGVCANTGFF